MNIKTNLKRIWSAVAALSLGLLIYSWLGGAEESSPNLLNTLLALNCVMVLLALPCSLFSGAIIFFAWYVLEMNPLSLEGAYLNTILLSVLGFVQWFWIARVWSPTETPFQELKLT